MNDYISTALELQKNKKKKDYFFTFPDLQNKKEHGVFITTISVHLDGYQTITKKLGGAGITTTSDYTVIFDEKEDQIEKIKKVLEEAKIEWLYLIEEGYKVVTYDN